MDSSGELVMGLLVGVQDKTSSWSVWNTTLVWIPLEVGAYVLPQTPQCPIACRLYACRPRQI